MILLRLLTVCFFYLVLSGIFADPEHLVKISFISQGKLLLFTQYTIHPKPILTDFINVLPNF